MNNAIPILRENLKEIAKLIRNRAEALERLTEENKLVAAHAVALELEYHTAQLRKHLRALGGLQ